VAELDEWLSGAVGSYIVYAPPLSGTAPFIDEVGGRRDQRTLLVAATMGVSRTPASTLESVSSVVDCSPSESGGSARTGSPGDLTGISMPVSEFLRVADSPTVGIDSVSTILYYAEEAAVFRFLSVLSAQIRRKDGLGLFVTTPEAHDERTVHTFAQVADGRIDLKRDRFRIDAPESPDGWQAR